MSWYRKINKWLDKEIIEDKREMAIKKFAKEKKDRYDYTSEGYLLAILHKNKEGKWRWSGSVIEGSGNKQFNTPIEAWDDMTNYVYDKY